MSCHNSTKDESGWLCLLTGLDAGGTADEGINDSTVTSSEQQQATIDDMTEMEKQRDEADVEDDVTTQQQSDEEMDHDDQEEELKDIKQTGEQLSITETNCVIGY